MRVLSFDYIHWRIDEKRIHKDNIVREKPAQQVSVILNYFSHFFPVNHHGLYGDFSFPFGTCKILGTW
jgi:hypothetical protein